MQVDKVLFSMKEFVFNLKMPVNSAFLKDFRVLIPKRDNCYSAGTTPVLWLF